jgi:hypothetical protein
MLEIILLIVGIVYAFRRPKLKRLAPADYSDVEETQFLEWKAAQLKAIDIFLWATWGAFFIKLAIQFIIIAAAQSGGGLSSEAGIGIMIAIIIAWLIGLIIAASYGSKAKKLCNAAGIRWPKK